MKKFLTKFVKDESGATAIEYGLIAAFISVAIVVAVRATGTQLTGLWTSIQNALTTS